MAFAAVSSFAQSEGTRLRSGDNAQALSAAKAAVKSHYPDPRYWAGFVLID